MSPNKNGRRGANPSAFGTTDKRAICDVCGTEKAIEYLIEAHGAGAISPRDHIRVCNACDIPDGYWGCGCGG